MAIAVSPPVQIPNLTPDYLSLTQSNGGSAPARTLSSPGGTRRTVPAGQQFGRYQFNPAEGNSQKSPSAVSLEALAALLSSSPEEPFLDSSPPARSGGYYTIRPERFRKSNSFPVLKSSYSSVGHYEPRPPVRKTRSVKFADAKGLPLESVRKLTAADPFQTEGEIVPKLLSDLGALSLKREPTTPPADKTLPKTPVRKLHFNQPGTQPDFYNKLRGQMVSLESVTTSQPRAIHGIVRVMNIAYDKDVSIRWTHDNWRTHHDSKCSYCQGSSDGVTDRFSFTIPANGDDIQFAICYSVQREEYWDSYNGKNYLISIED